MVLIINNIYFLLAIGGVSIILAIVLGAEFFQLIRKYKRILYLLIAISIIQSIFTHDENALFSIFGIQLLTKKGLLLGVKTFIRMIVILTSGVIMSTSNYRESIQGLIQWKIPYKLAFMSSMSLRFIPIFSQEFNDSLTALQLRGVDIYNIPFKQKSKIYIYLFLPILMNVMKRAEELSIAMESRAFGAYPSRVEYLVLKLKFPDYAIMLTAILLSAGFILLSFNI